MGAADLWQTIRLSWTGHGWIIWLTCAGSVTAALLHWAVLAVVLTVVELVAVTSLIGQLHRRRRRQRRSR